jgi:peptide deformylase
MIVLTEEQKEAYKQVYADISNCNYNLIPIEETLKINMEDIEDYEIGMLISHKLFKVLDNCTTAQVLTANQVGLKYNVMVLNVREPLFFINPKILDEQGPIEYLESDNSYIGKIAETFRFGRILVSAANLKSPIWFGVKGHQLDLLKNKFATTHPVVQECVAIQHGFDLLHGITMYDRTEPYTYKQPKEPSRNDMVTIYKDNTEVKIKYKKLAEFLNKGWSLKK